MIRRPLLVALIAATISAGAAQPLSQAADQTPPRAEVGQWGIDLSAQDAGTKAGDDFFKHANGRWLATNEIPPDRTAWGVGAQLSQAAEVKVRAIIESQPANAPAGSSGQKVGDYYRAFLDTQSIERAGLAPAKPALDAIDSARSRADIAQLMGRPDFGLRSPINLSITIDEKNPDRYIVEVRQGGLGLPEREYYLSKDARFAELRQKYVAHIERMLGLAGEGDASAQSQSILALETQIAERHWPIAKRRERELTYNLRSREQVLAMGADFPWIALLGAAKLDAQRELVVSELDAVEMLAKGFTQTPVSAWRSYLKYHYLATMAYALPKAYDDERFDFYGRTLNGQPTQRERWKRAVTALSGVLSSEQLKQYDVF